jgi:hypothetical protein
MRSEVSITRKKIAEPVGTLSDKYLTYKHR